MTSMSDDPLDVRERTSGAAVAFTALAGSVMMVMGSFHIIEGLAGVVNDEFYKLTEHYVFELDAVVWGWLHLLLGVVILLAGIGVFRGALWARTVAVVLVVVSAIASFAFLPLYPFWSLVMIVVSLFTLWALTAHGRDLSRV
jgi:hypothetical protein